MTKVLDELLLFRLAFNLVHEWRNTKIEFTVEAKDDWDYFTAFERKITKQQALVIGRTRGT